MEKEKREQSAEHGHDTERLLWKKKDADEQEMKEKEKAK